MATALAAKAFSRRGSRTSLSLLLGLALLSLYLPVRQYSRATSLLLHISDRNAQGFFADYDARPVNVIPTTIPGPSGPVRAKLYLPVGLEHAPAMVVLHGVHHLGIEEPRLVNFAQALASHGVIILTPELSDLADYHVDPNAIPTIGASLQFLSKQTGAPKVGLLGLSFAGGLGLIAAADPRYADTVSFVVAIGAHDDLARVLRFYATNQIARPDGTVVTMQAHEYGPLVVAYAYPEQFFATEDIPVARKAIKLWLWEKFDDARAHAATLSPAGHQKMTLLFDHRIDVLGPELLAGIAKYPEVIASVSPTHILKNIRCPVLLVHGAGDNVIPATETLWLAADTPPHLTIDVLISPAISHVEVGGKGPTLRDKLNLVHFMSEMLSEADGSPRSSKSPAALLNEARQTSTTWSH
jgi:dienelactone hydrolase